MQALMKSPTLRAFIWRLGRKLYCMARRETNNTPEANGEYWLLDEAIVAQPTDNTSVLVDVGANIGDWTYHALSSLSRQNRTGHVHAFEPTASTFAHLTERFQSTEHVRLHHAALSNHSGETELFVVGACAGTNSLIETAGAVAETVHTQTFDSFLAEQDIGFVSFVKSDTEGHDFSVMQGAAESLRQGKIDIWQFEYNHRWLANGSSLRDVFAFIADKPYRIGKLYGDGIECYADWHPELDRFFETNCVLLRRGSPVETQCTLYRFDESNTPVPA